MSLNLRIYSDVIVEFSGALKTSFREHLGLLIIVLVSVIAANWAAVRFDISLVWALSLYMPKYVNFLWKLVLLLFAGYLLWLTIVIRPKRPLTMLIEHMSERFMVSERIATAVPVLFITPVFAGAFTTFKSTLGVFKPFSWDPTFVEWDTWLHFGHAPWTILQPIVGYPVVTWTLMVLYNLWFFVLAFFWFWQTFSLRDKHLRLQFFYALLLSWTMLGFVAANYFSSAGPCYFGRVTGGADPFVPLLDYLYEVSEHRTLWALETQAALWGHYETHAMVPGSGISAMPSVHVATALLFFLAARRHARWLGWIFFTFFLMIFVGSVHLAWHYAIDGYASVIALLPIWWLSGKLAGISTSQGLSRRNRIEPL